ncbi:hypothetical protein EGR_03766 [Echinococcus granulosus]|uniref:Uncharacterized protein n=1 Tax=Echinococcus granulosus TaxID=6210 RepID=W6UII3_ECHGR|nr:hypothetical protein EGR_03766 [Echinococcus granulosus]EUB61280.1 hypothetical protein EGR_03766 [Echinococcus granulosus]
MTTCEVQIKFFIDCKQTSKQNVSRSPKCFLPIILSCAVNKANEYFYLKYLSNYVVVKLVKVLPRLKLQCHVCLFESSCYNGTGKPRFDIHFAIDGIAFIHSLIRSCCRWWCCYSLIAQLDHNSFIYIKGFIVFIAGKTKSEQFVKRWLNWWSISLKVTIRWRSICFEEECRLLCSKLRFAIFQKVSQSRTSCVSTAKERSKSRDVNPSHNTIITSTKQTACETKSQMKHISFQKIQLLLIMKTFNFRRILYKDRYDAFKMVFTPFSGKKRDVGITVCPEGIGSVLNIPENDIQMEKCLRSHSFVYAWTHLINSWMFF